MLYLYLVWEDLASPLTMRPLGHLLVVMLTPTGGGQPHPFGGVIIGYKTFISTQVKNTGGRGS